jgi:hypothetical protein
MLRCVGEVVRFERKPWAMEGRTGTSQTARVLVGRADFVDVNVPEQLGIAPRDGDQVDWAVLVTSPGGRAKITLQGDWSAVVGSATRLAPPAVKVAG